MNKLEVENKLKDNKLPEGWAKVRLDSLLIESKERNITNKKLLVFSITNVKGFVLQMNTFHITFIVKKLQIIKYLEKIILDIILQE